MVIRTHHCLSPTRRPAQPRREGDGDDAATGTAAPADSTGYEIRLGSRLEPRWADWFDGMTLASTGDDGTTTLRGPVPDQAALHGCPGTVRDLGVPLISVTAIDPDEPRASGNPPTNPRNPPR